MSEMSEIDRLCQLVTERDVTIHDQATEIERLRKIEMAARDINDPAPNNAMSLTEDIRLYFKRGLPERDGTVREWWPHIFDAVHLLCDRVEALNPKENPTDPPVDAKSTKR